MPTIQEVDFSTIPNGARLFTARTCNARAYIWETTRTRADGRPITHYHVKAYAPRAARKAAIFEYSSNGEWAEKRAQGFVDGYDTHAARKAEEKARRNGPCTLKVGDILYSSWGYEQTNIDFYEVVSVSGRSVSVEEIGAQMVSHMPHGMAGECVADPAHRSGKITRHIVQYGNHISFNSHRTASPWDGKPKYTSWYA